MLQMANRSMRIDPASADFLSPGVVLTKFSNKNCISHEPELLVTSVCEENSSEFSNTLSGKLNVGGSYGCFSGSASAEFNSMSGGMSKSVMIMDQLVTKLYRFSPNARHFDLLEDFAKTILETYPPEQIHREIGDFFISSVSFGAIFEKRSLVELKRNESKESAKAEFHASGTWGVGSASGME